MYTRKYIFYGQMLDNWNLLYNQMFTFDGLSPIREKQILGNRHKALPREITGLQKRHSLF
jgi:hypothetical protein